MRSALLVEKLTLCSLVQDQIAFLVKREKYTLSDFQEGLKAGIDKAVSDKMAQAGEFHDTRHLLACSRTCQGLDGWRKHMPGVKSNPAYEEMQMSMAILNAVPQELRDNPGKLKAEAKLKIAKESGRTVTEINKILGRYEVRLCTASLQLWGIHPDVSEVGIAASALSKSNLDVSVGRKRKCCTDGCGSESQ